MVKRYCRRAEFAAMNGWSPSYVTKLAHQGRLVFGPTSKLINIAASMANVSATTDKKGNGESVGSQYWLNRVKREDALANLVELVLGKRKGLLLDRESVESLAFGTGRLLRDTALGLPPRLAPEIAAMTDSHAIEVKLRGEFVRLFDDMERLAAEDLAKLVVDNQKANVP